MITINGKKTVSGCCVLVIAEQLIQVCPSHYWLGLFFILLKIIGQFLITIGLGHKAYKLYLFFRARVKC